MPQLEAQTRNAALTLRKVNEPSFHHGRPGILVIVCDDSDPHAKQRISRHAAC